jgi:hypothetical protein
VLLPFLVRLCRLHGSARDYWTGFLKAAAALAGVVMLFEAAMKLYMRIPPGAMFASAYGNVTYYVEDYVKFIAHFGSLRGAAAKFGRSLLELVRPVCDQSIGLLLPLSLAVWARRAETAADKQVRILWWAAVVWTLLPLLLYTSENNFPPVGRYQIVAIPLYLLAVLYGLARLPRLAGKPAVRVGMKGLLVVLTMAGCLTFIRYTGFRKEPYFGSVREIYADFEELPRRLTALKMPMDGAYMARVPLDVFLPDSRTVELPPKSVFSAGGRNRGLDGIILFVNKKDLLNPEKVVRRNGKRGYGLSSVIRDEKGVRFGRVYAGREKGGLAVYRREESE